MPPKSKRQALPSRTELAATDPLKIPEWIWEELGFKKLPPLRAIRRYCYTGCLENWNEVRKCEDIECALWPYRMGTNPFRKRNGGDDA